MTSIMLQYIPLTSAYLCQDCDCVGNSASYCPACSSRALLSLACVLNRNVIGAAIPMTGFLSTATQSAPALAA